MSHFLNDADATKEYYNSHYLAGHEGYFTKERTQKEIYFLIEELGRFPDAVCDVACGQGRHLLEFKKHGLKHGFGFDQSETLVEMADKSLGDEGFEVARSSYDEWQPELDRYDLTYCLFTAFGHSETDEAAAALVGKMVAATRKGGLICIDIDNVFDLLTYLDNRRKIKVGGKSEFQFNATDLTLTHRKRKGETIMDFKIRFFTAPEFRNFFKAAGIKDEDIWFKGDFDGEEFNVESKRIIALAQKS